MKNAPAGKSATSYDRLEEKAATLLGKILFQFSRLEMELGLCIVWTEGGLHLEELTRKYENSNFNDRLKCLAECVNRLLPASSESHASYMTWIDQANATRKLRNDLVHGRWGIEIQNQRVVNVTGLPTSQDQRSDSYSLAQLKTVIDNLVSLRTCLGTLRKTWPL